MKTRNKKSQFFIYLLSFFILLLIWFNFFFNVPPFQISSGIIVLLAFLIILALSEEFDRFSIFKILTLSRGIKVEKNKNQELTKENSELRSQIVSISAINQKQVNSTIFLSDELAKTFNVLPAKKSEKEEADQTDQQQSYEALYSNDDSVKEPKNRYLLSRKIEDFAFDKYLNTEGFQKSFVLKNAKFNKHFEKIDPVSEFSPIFDGYVKYQETEIFIEVKIVNRNVLMMRERIYLMLSKINYYRKVKTIDACLILILVNKADESHNNNIIEKLIIEFEPAISTGLLRINELEISNEELNELNNSIDH